MHAAANTKICLPPLDTDVIRAHRWEVFITRLISILIDMHSFKIPFQQSVFWLNSNVPQVMLQSQVRIILRNKLIPTAYAATSLTTGRVQSKRMLSSAVKERCNRTRPLSSSFYVSGRENAGQRYLSSSPTSSAGTGILDKMRHKIQERTENKKKVQAMEQLQKMSDLEVWNIKAFASELDSSLSDWTTKIPGMGKTKEIKAMKESRKIIDAFTSQLGENAQAEDLVNLGKKEKLKICVDAEITMEDANLVIQQFKNMDMMHRVLRYRKQTRKPIPTDDASMRNAIREDAPKIITKREKKEMQTQMSKKIGRIGKGRR